MKLPVNVAEFRYVPVVAAILVVGANSSPRTAHSAAYLAPVIVDSTPRGAAWSRDTLVGLSGKLWMKLMAAPVGDTTSVLARLLGDSALQTPGVYAVRDSASVFSFINLVPFSAKKKGMLGSYRMGFWPAEQRTTVSDRYGNPAGFIEVTPENQDSRISENFRLRDFLTKDQSNVWPKYLVLQEGLIDKLELVIGALGQQGIPVTRMSVMSGFRTPQYNQRGVGGGGRAQNSRHQYGDAADIFVDNDGDGGMDDLNGDGRVNIADARFLARIVEQVEEQYPALAGGVGVYSATSAHGPFVHVDVRGVKARW